MTLLIGSIVWFGLMWLTIKFIQGANNNYLTNEEIDDYYNDRANTDN